MTNVEALKNLYVSCGGNLEDTYEDIADGIPVSEYAVIPDIVNAISKRMAIATEALTRLISLTGA